MSENPRFWGGLRLICGASDAIVIVGPTGSSAKTCGGQTYHSFFGFRHQYLPTHKDPVEEAAHLLKQPRWGPIKLRLARVRAILIDEVAMISAQRLDIMRQLIHLCQPWRSPACSFYPFGDFLQLRPPHGDLSFESTAWRQLFRDDMLELTRVHRQNDGDFVAVIRDARFGLCTEGMANLMRERTVVGAAYAKIETTVLHLLSKHKDVWRRNNKCLLRINPVPRPHDFIAVDGVEEDPDRDPTISKPILSVVTAATRAAALVECAAPMHVQHCLNELVMMKSNSKISLGLFHGNIGTIVSYSSSGAPIVRFENHRLPEKVARGADGLLDAGKDWLVAEITPVSFKARVWSVPGVIVVRLQVPPVLGWAMTVHRSQSLTLSQAVLDVGEAFEDCMVPTAFSRVSEKQRMCVKTFCGTRMRADVAAVQFYRDGRRL